MYVAITRARRRLYLSFAQSRMLHGQVNYSLVSSFLRELPDELLHWITPRVAARKSVTSFGYSAPLTPNPSETPSPSGRGHGVRGGRGEHDSAGEGRNSSWRIGQAVMHTKFGEGMIVNIEGGGADARVQVNFRKAGTKWLALEYAKLAAL